jgi:hypothetical protein
LYLQELLAGRSTVLVPYSAAALIRMWDVRWGQYQQKLLAARERKREQAVRRRTLPQRPTTLDASLLS